MNHDSIILMSLFLFSLGWVAILYIFNSVIALKFKQINIATLSVYVSSVALIGMCGEIFLGNVYYLIFETPLWEYRILPIHDAYTSLYSVVIWGMYGFHLYLLHDTFDGKRFISERTLILLFSIEAIILEILLNLSSLVVFNEYVFYYFPTDLWHLTSVQAIPLYFLGGIVIAKTLKRFKTDPKFFILMNACLLVVIAVLSS